MAFHLNDQNFDSTVQKGVVLVDFYATWCGPCKMIAPVIEELSKEYETKAIVGKLDVDASPMTAQKYGVMSIPTLLIFKDGKIVGKQVGFLPKESLKKALDQAIQL